MATTSKPAPKASAKPKTYKFPKNLGTCADRYYEIRERRKEMKAELAVVEAEYQALKNHLIDTLPKSEASGVAGKIANVKITKRAVPKPEDWDKTFKYIKRTGRFDLLQRRLSDSAIQEMWESGKEVPGVTHYNVIDISCTKV
jgi:hypothetical protein